MNITEIENALYAWINGSLGMEAIFAYPNAPRPTTSYVLINILSDIQLGTEETRSVELANESIDNSYGSLNEITISLNTYYDGAFQKAIDIKKSLMSILVSDTLWTSGLGYASSTAIQKIPELIDEAWEERAQFDIVFNVREVTTDNIETIKKVEVNNITIGED